MCGRARLSSDVSEIKLVFSIPPHRPTPNFAPSWNVTPTDPLPVDEQRQRHAERNAIVVTAWEIARQKGATIEERWEIYQREVARLSREFEEKWGVPARV
jgi:putative SOS response-associated peptidase YedK